MIVLIQISYLDSAKITCFVMRWRRIIGKVPETDPLIAHVWLCVLPAAEAAELQVY